MGKFEKYFSLIGKRDMQEDHVNSYFFSQAQPGTWQQVSELTVELNGFKDASPWPLVIYCWSWTV